MKLFLKQKLNINDRLPNYVIDIKKYKKDKKVLIADISIVFLELVF